MTLSHEEALVLADNEELALVEGDAPAELLTDWVPRTALSVGDCDDKGEGVKKTVGDENDVAEGELLMLELKLSDPEALTDTLAQGEELVEALELSAALVDALAKCVVLMRSVAVGDLEGIRVELALADIDDDTEADSEGVADTEREVLGLPLTATDLDGDCSADRLELIHSDAATLWLAQLLDEGDALADTLTLTECDAVELGLSDALDDALSVECDETELLTDVDTLCEALSVGTCAEGVSDVLLERLGDRLEDTQVEGDAANDADGCCDAESCDDSVPETETDCEALNDPLPDDDALSELEVLLENETETLELNVEDEHALEETDVLDVGVSLLDGDSVDDAQGDTDEDVKGENDDDEDPDADVEIDEEAVRDNAPLTLEDSESEAVAETLALLE